MTLAAGFGYTGLVLGLAALVFSAARYLAFTWKAERDLGRTSVALFALAVLSFLTAVWIEVSAS